MQDAADRQAVQARSGADAAIATEVETSLEACLVPPEYRLL